MNESAHGGTIKAGGLQIEVAAPQVVSWIYSDPRAASTAAPTARSPQVELTVDGRTLRTEHGGAWELGTREAPPGVEAQPYPDP